MSTQTEIQQEEQELHDLLLEVMKGPLQPVVDSIEEIHIKLQHLEDSKIEEMSRLESFIGKLDSDSEDILKILKKIKSDTEESQGIINNISCWLQDTTNSTSEQLKGIFSFIENSNIDLHRHVSNCIGRIESTHDLKLRQFGEIMEAKLDGLQRRLSNDFESGQKVIGDIRVSLTDCFSELKDISSVAAEKTICQTQIGFSDLEKHVSKFQTSDAQLAEQMSVLRQQQDSIGVVLRRELTLALLPIRKWLFVTTLLATAALGGVAVFVFGKYL